MNKFFKWFSLITCLVAIPFIVLLASDGEWLSIITWAFLGITSYFNYMTLDMMEKSDDDRS